MSPLIHYPIQYLIPPNKSLTLTSSKAACEKFKV